VSRHQAVGEVLAGARTRLVGGLPTQRIQEVALQEDAALIVIGSRGRVGWSRLAAGSVAAEVAKHSPIPVTVVKALGPQHRQPGAEVMGSSEWWIRRVPLHAVRTGIEGEEPGV
jgi:K+-sensing histidine kinase KdpD